MRPHERILVALDVAEETRAIELAGALRGRVGGVKVGLELFVAAGPGVVGRLVASGMPVFLDLKLHDIPNTVGRAAAAAARLGVSWLTVHALGGSAMIREAVERATRSAGEAGVPPPVVLGVTILTSHDDAGLEAVGLEGPSGPAVTRLARLAREAGAGGIVCSPHEIVEVRASYPSGTLVVPGIRPAGRITERDDQARVAGPGAAIRAGADRIVVGRPITRAEDPAAAAEAIAREIQS